jgi:hypothetical protein
MFRVCKIYIAQDKVQWPAIVNTAVNIQIPQKEDFLDYMNKKRFFKETQAS